MSPRGCAAAAALVAILAGAGCGGGDSEDPEVIVAAASSLAPAFTAYAEVAGFDARQSFAGSDEIAAQIRAGTRPDLYAAANAALPRQLHAEGLVSKPVAFATNRLVIAVPDDSDSIHRIADLAQPGVRLAIGAAGVPIGDYTRELLTRLGPEESAAILDNVRSEEPEVAGVVGKLAQGAVEAGFVYVTDVEAASGELEAIELPSRLQPGVSYAAAVVRGADHPGEARDFIEGLLAGDGEQALRAAGFGPPPEGR